MSARCYQQRTLLRAHASKRLTVVMPADWQPGRFGHWQPRRDFLETRTHKYRIGQSVRYDAGLRRFASSATFKIIQLLPADGGYGQYRIKSASEAYERVVKENEINLDF